ncbi:MAG: LacI family DNA-binding transcriptional regulator [Capsulimonadales bacterium]|nr:LacI family DNA-binding transcriptional regulator [Capsulimonadales bacterium]
MEKDRVGRNITLRDIAERMNLSVTTVADALKDRPNVRVAPATREAVRQEAARLGYQPNVFARRLVNRRAGNLIGLVSKRFSGYHIRERQYTQLHCALAETEYELAFVSAAHQERLAEAVNGFLRLQPAALLWATEWKDPPALEAALTEYIEAGGIVVSFDDDRDVPCDSVVFDEIEHAELAMRHLLELGHRFIGVGLDEWPHGLHAQGVFRALTACGLDPERHLRFYPSGDWHDFEDGTATAEAWLAQADRPAAMSLFNDRKAAGFIRRVTDAGVRVPEDVSVIGHDNENFCPYLATPLTTVTRFESLIVETALELLRDRLERRYVGPPRRRVIRSRVIVRASTAPVRGPGT